MPNTGAQLVRAASGAGWTTPTAIEGTASQALRNVVPHGVTPLLIGTNALLNVPAGATINGIVVSATGQANTVSELGFSGIRLVLGGVAIGTSKNPASSDWLDIPEAFTYGSSIDLWGAALTAANVNDPTFGFQAAVTNFSPNGETALVNAYTITAYYSGGGGTAGASNGGISVPLNMLLIPAQIGSQYSFYTLDPTNFNDANSGGFYNWKVEDVIAGRTPTVSRVIISYRDLGPATFTLVLTGTNDAGQVVAVQTPVAVGTQAASRKIVTKVLGLALTAQNIQASIIRAANAGPLSITKLRLEGRVETTVLA